MGLHVRRRGVISGAAGFSPIVATGGDSVDDVDIGGVEFRVHQFTTVGTSSFVVSDLGNGDGNVDVLLVAGGGGGGGAGGNGGSGGGGGGVVKASATASVDVFTVNVGFGGPRGDGSGNIGFNGGNSESFGFLALGGGGGEGGGTPPGKDGGSGGGSRDSGNEGQALQPGTNPTAVIDNGNNSGFLSSGGGGGGAGGSGNSNDGGPGINLNFDGSARFFGAGGNGQFSTLSSGGQTTDQNVALPNVGAGGAGTFSDTRVGNVGTGGSGIVIIRYPLVAT